MTTKFKLLALVIIVYGLLGCTQNEEEKLESYFQELGTSISSYKYVAIINVDACSSCSNIVMDFLAINSDNKDLLVILSSISLKKAGLMIEEYSGKTVILIDSNQLALKKFHLIQLKPVIYAVHENFLFQEVTLSDLGQLWVEKYFDK
uniref:hypothetical protein n=1 Tax=Roseivirga sp. TaxID=1964215 RepID=UPI0040487F12